MDMDTGVFQPYAPVPMTETKQILFDSTETELDDHIEAFLEWLPGRVIALKMVSALWREYAAKHKAFDIPGSAVYSAVKKKTMRPKRDDPRWPVRIGDALYRPRYLPKAVTKHDNETLIMYCRNQIQMNLNLIPSTTRVPDSKDLNKDSDD
jgi:hypothetical protein